MHQTVAASYSAHDKLCQPTGKINESGLDSLSLQSASQRVMMNNSETEFKDRKMLS